MIRLISTDRAPKALGPYSQAVAAGDFLFTAGQIGMDPESGELAGADITIQTDRALCNLRHVIQEAGFEMRHVVKTTVFLLDLGDFPAFNAAYELFFDGHKPARSTVQVAALPLGAFVEIEAICSRF